MANNVVIGDTKCTRTPKMSACSNEADQLKRCMQEDGREKWGFVTYRCTCASSSALGDVALGSQGSKSHNSEDMIGRLEMTAIDDPKTLDGASTGVARKKFKEWSAEADTDDWIKRQRLRFCLQVDNISLQSVLDAATNGL